MYVLQCGKYNHIVNWQLDSEQNEHHFIVQDIDEFTKQVLPIFFKVAKYESFQRKLYRWGFIKTRRTRAEKMKSPKSVCYVHPCFRQGDYNGAAQMTCSGASVEICKSTQKHRKRQQRQKGSKDNNSKRQRTSATAAAKNEDLDQNQQQMMMMMQQQPAAAVLPSMQESTTVTAMPGLNMQMHPSNNFLSIPQKNNMFMMMNALPSNAGMILNTMPRLPNASNMPSIPMNERIEDDSFATIISRDSCTLNAKRSDNKTMMMSEMSNIASATQRPAEDNIPQLLARARTQREIKRIQMNSLMREEMLQELLQTDPMDWTAGADVNTATTTAISDASLTNSMMMSTSTDDNMMEQSTDIGNINHNGNHSAASQFMRNMNSGDNKDMVHSTNNVNLLALVATSLAVYVLVP